MGIQFQDLSEIEQIELILLEASAYNLREEVEIYAKRNIADGMSSVEAYEEAFNEWIK